MLKDDGDIVKALGYLTLYSSYLEEQIELLVKTLEPVKPYTKGWHISDKIGHAKKALRKLDSAGFCELQNDLTTCLELFFDRNELIHGRIFAGVNGTDILKTGRSGVPDREINSFQVYLLANEFWKFQCEVYSSVVSDIRGKVEIAFGSESCQVLSK